MDALTGLRGVGAMWVLLHHWDTLKFGIGHGYHGLVVGYLGVDLFFLLSGFVLAYSKRLFFTRTDASEYGRFLLERGARLFPANAAVLLCYALALLVVPAVMAHAPATTFTLPAFIAGLLLVQSWVQVWGWNEPAWSVSSELAAYACLPLVLTVARRMSSSRAALAAAAGALVAFIAILVLHGEHDPNVLDRGGFIRLACEFSAGAMLHEAWARGARVPVRSASIVAVGSLAVATLVPVAEATFAALPAFALLVMLSAQGEGVVVRLLSTRPVMAAGAISYSLYLVHWPVLVICARLGVLAAGWAPQGTMLVGIVALAIVLHGAIEKPSHRLARRIGRKRTAMPFTGTAHRA